MIAQEIFFKLTQLSYKPPPPAERIARGGGESLGGRAGGAGLAARGAGPAAPRGPPPGGCGGRPSAAAAGVSGAAHEQRAAERPRAVLGAALGAGDGGPEAAERVARGLWEAARGLAAAERRRAADMAQLAELTRGQAAVRQSDIALARQLIECVTDVFIGCDFT